MAEKTFNRKMTAKERDSPARWAVWDAWWDAVLLGALNGVFDLREDGKVAVAFHDNNLDVVRKATIKRLAKCKIKKFKKNKYMGYDAISEKGTRAFAARIYDRKVYGIPKPMPKAKKATPKKAKKVEPKPIERKEIGPPNPELPQTKAYVEARKREKKGEVLSYIEMTKKQGSKKTDNFIATYYIVKKKKKRTELIEVERPKVFVKKAKKKVVSTNGNAPTKKKKKMVKRT